MRAAFRSRQFARLRPSGHALLLLIVLLVALGVRVWGIGFGLPHPMTRPDEEFLLGVASRFFANDLNPHFFEWPSLYFYLVHAGLRGAYLIGRISGAYTDAPMFADVVAGDPAWAHLMLRLMSVTAAMGTIVIVYRSAGRLFNRDIGLAAAAFLALAYLHVRDSHFGVLDVPLTFAIVATIAVLVRASQDEAAARWFALAGLAAGLATSLKYNAGVLLVPAVVAAATTPGVGWAAALTRLASFAATFAVGFVAGTPYAVLDAPAFREGLAAQMTRLTDGHGIRIEQVWLRHLTFSLFYGVGWPVLVAGAIGVVCLTLADWRRAALVFSFPIVYFVVIGSGHTAFIRYVTPLVPFICLGAAVAVDYALRALGAATWTARRRAWTFAVLILVMAFPSIMTVVRFDRLMTRVDTRVQAADWLRRAMQPGQSLYESGASYARPHYAWGSSASFIEVEFDERRATFLTPGGPPIEPDWIVLAESPLRLYTPVPGALRGILTSRYERVAHFQPSRDAEPESIFDRQDAFFLPFADFEERERPGPTLAIYKRTAR
jgi:hypothetical protein